MTNRRRSLHRCAGVVLQSLGLGAVVLISFPSFWGSCVCYAAPVPQSLVVSLSLRFLSFPFDPPFLFFSSSLSPSPRVRPFPSTPQRPPGSCQRFPRTPLGDKWLRKQLFRDTKESIFRPGDFRGTKIPTKQAWQGFQRAEEQRTTHHPVAARTIPIRFTKPRGPAQHDKLYSQPIRTE